VIQSFSWTTSACSKLTQTQQAGAQLLAANKYRRDYKRLTQFNMTQQKVSRQLQITNNKEVNQDETLSSTGTHSSSPSVTSAEFFSYEIKPADWTD